MEAHNEKHNYKLNNEEFLAILKENNCIYAHTANAITKKYGIPYSRQAVEDRAKKFEKQMAQHRKEMHDFAIGTIYDPARQNKDLKLKYRAAQFIYNKLGVENASNKPIKNKQKKT